MNKFYQLSLFYFVALLALPGKSQASHNMGADITFVCLNSCTTRVEFRGYRDCSGVPFASPIVQWSQVGGSCAGNPTPLSSWSTPVITEVSPICPTTQTTCSGPSSYPGVQEYFYFADFATCNSNGCVLTVEYSNCCRNGAITSISGSNPFYVNSTISVGASCNNSPVFRETPYFMACMGQTSTVDQGAVDPDNDSLVYSLGPCYQSYNTPVGYLAGYSPTSPLGPSWNVSINSQNGQITVAPSPGNLVVGVVCIRIEEYRNNVLIGTYNRDMQLSIINCPGNSPPSAGAITNLSGGNTATGFTVNANSSPVCFDIGVNDPDASQTKTIFWDQSIPGATFVDANNASITDTVSGLNPVGRFCFSPPGPGVYTFMVTTEDNACPFIASSVQWITINYSGCVGSATISAMQLDCNTFDFSVTTSCLSPPLTYLWSVGGVTVSTSSMLNYSFLASGTYVVDVVVADMFGNTVSASSNVTVNMAPVYANLITVSGSINACTGTCATLTAPAGFVSYQWNNGGNSNPITECSVGLMSVTVEDAGGCYQYDTVTLSGVGEDISGTITTSTAAPLANQPVYLIRFDTTGGGTLTLIDTDITNSSGQYQFCSITDTMVYVKAAPDSATYPNEMPTYFNGALLWSGATGVPATSFPATVNFSTLAGGNPGGPGFIGGLISQGANKMAGPGDPVEGLTLFLVNENTGDAVDLMVTAADGLLNFADLPVGTYRVYTDKPGISTNLDSVPQIEITALQPLRDDLEFVLHSTWLELLEPQASGTPKPACSPDVFPNPTRGEISIRFCNANETLVRYEFINAGGQVVKQESLSPGIYSVRIWSDKAQYFERVTVIR